MKASVPVVYFVLLLLAAGCSDSGDSEPGSLSTGADVIHAMQQAHADNWYESLTFVQTTINYFPDGSVDTTTWYEAMMLPGKLRIDIGSPTSGETMIFRNDSLYVFSQGQLSNAVPTIHPLLLLGFDVYHLPEEDVVARLDTLGFDMSKTYETEWRGRQVIAVGSDKPDNQHPEFWVDLDRMVFVRLLQNVGPERSIRQDVRFDDYRPMGQAWIAPQVEFYADSTVTMKERYHDMRPNVELESGFFDPSSWQDADHWFEDGSQGS